MCSDKAASWFAVRLIFHKTTSMMKCVCLVAILSVVQSGYIVEAGLCSVEKAQVEARLNATPKPLGLNIPLCDTDGSYLPVQYKGSKAVCVTPDGEKIRQYEVNMGATGPDMDCQCARDQYDYLQTGWIGKMFHCEYNGNYASIGCRGSVCYCQDKYGKQVGTSTVHVAQLNSLTC